MKQPQEVILSGASTCYCSKHMASQQLKNESKWCEQNVWLEFKDFSDGTDGTEQKYIMRKEQAMCLKTNANTDTNLYLFLVLFCFVFFMASGCN